MLARMMRRRLWAASLLVGLGLITAACGASTPARGITSLTPSSSPTATITPAATATATSVAVAGCTSYPFLETPPGPLPTPIPFPPGTLIENRGMGIQAGSVDYGLCTPGATPAAITAFMNSALPAAGWLRHSAPACTGTSYDWYKGHYGMDIVFFAYSPPDLWALVFCPHVGQY